VLCCCSHQQLVCYDATCFMVTGVEWWEATSSAPSRRARAPAAQLCFAGPALGRSPPKHDHQDWNATASGIAEGLGCSAVLASWACQDRKLCWCVWSCDNAVFSRHMHCKLCDLCKADVAIVMAILPQPKCLLHPELCLSAMYSSQQWITKLASCTPCGWPTAVAILANTNRAEQDGCACRRCL